VENARLLYVELYLLLFALLYLCWVCRRSIGGQRERERSCFCNPRRGGVGDGWQNELIGRSCTVSDKIKTTEGFDFEKFKKIASLRQILG
jgi:hypothetical protein